MEELQYIDPKDIKPNPYQPRQQFHQEKLEELAQSIRENGIIQPLIVRKSSIIGYELLAGERRLRASQLAGMQKVPVVIKHLTDDDLLYQSIIENLQRTDLNPIEEAASYQKLVEKGLRHDEIAQIMGKSRPYITNLTRLLNLSPETIQAVKEGRVSQGHARLLLSLSAEQQAAWVEKIEQSDISVRRLENLLASKKGKKARKKTDLFIQEEEEKLSRLLGTKVQIKNKKDGQGQITISFASPQEFERIINTLK